MGLIGYAVLQAQIIVRRPSGFWPLGAQYFLRQLEEVLRLMPRRLVQGLGLRSGLTLSQHREDRLLHERTLPDDSSYEESENSQVPC